MVRTFTKERLKPRPDSIPALLGMFERELRFYREIAPDVGVRVPACYQAEETEDGYRLVLEDLSSWDDGADPFELVSLLAELHRRWEGEAQRRWPWLERPTAAAREIGRLYDDTWATVRERPETTAALSDVGGRYVGEVERLERDEATFGRLTMVHGDASARNARTSPAGEVAMVDWEDVRLASGSIDLTWLLVSSVEPTQWDAALDAYGAAEAELQQALPYALTQGILALSNFEPGSPDATAWAARLDEGARRLL